MDGGESGSRRTSLLLLHRRETEIVIRTYQYIWRGRLFEMNEKGKEKMSTASVKETRAMKLKLIGYWVTTAIVAGEQLAGGVTDLIHGGTRVVGGESVVLLMEHLGYPVYLLMLLGPASLCGGIALLVPRFPRLKEWAYAGIFIEYVGAVFSKVAVPGFVRGDDPGTLLWTPLILAVLTLVSWALRPQSRTLGVLFPARSRA
jgi:uncharacterized membrane protein YphA (DoxX/SURF4 family)